MFGFEIVVVSNKRRTAAVVPRTLQPPSVGFTTGQENSAQFHRLLSDQIFFCEKKWGILYTVNSC